MEGFNPSSIPILPISYTYANLSGSGGSSCSSSQPKCDGNTSPWMDSRIWSRLPISLIDRVIALLPPPAFFRARSVCKRWYGLLFSNTFLQLYLQVSPRRHWFLFFSRKSLNKNYIYRSNSNNGDRENSEAYLFNPEDVSWNRIPFPLVPPGFSPASSSGGLVCWVSDEAGSKSLLLSNPLLGRSIIPLPPTLRPRLFPSVGMAVTNTSVDLVVAGDDLISPFAVKNLTAESFHVDGGGFYSLWGTSSSLPRLCSLESGRMVCGGGGRFYCMNYSPFSVLAYDVATNHWCKIQAPMRRFLRSPNLVESRGKMILIAAVEKSKLNIPKSLRLWGLQSCGTTWVEIDRMPQQLYVQFEDVEAGKGFNCVGHGEFIIIAIRGSDRAVLFDFYRKRWLWIPPCPFACSRGVGAGGGGGGGGELHGFAYDPRLAIPVTGLVDQLALPFQPFSG